MRGGSGAAAWDVLGADDLEVPGAFFGTSFFVPEGTYTLNISMRRLSFAFHSHKAKQRYKKYYHKLKRT